MTTLVLPDPELTKGRLRLFPLIPTKRSTLLPAYASRLPRAKAV